MDLQLAVSKSYGEFTLNADFRVTGDRVGIFGPSGSGKSTLVSLLAGTLLPDSGTIRIGDSVLFDSSRRLATPPEVRRVAVVFQHPHLFPHMNVRGNLVYGYRRCRSAQRRIHPPEVAEVLELEGLLDRPVEHLSGGEKQRVAIGRAVLSNPRLLLMDEPLSALDDALKFRIIPYLKSVSERFGIPFLFISHSLVEMRLMAETVMVLDRGEPREICSGDDIARRRLPTSQVGYINLLRMTEPQKSQGLWKYRWGGSDIVLTDGCCGKEGVFELSSKDLILFRRHPEASSARNLLRCRVVGTFAAGAKRGVELECGGERVVAEVVEEAVTELGIAPGAEVFAAVKASAFRKLF